MCSNSAALFSENDHGSSVILGLRKRDSGDGFSVPPLKEADARGHCTVCETLVVY